MNTEKNCKTTVKYVHSYDLQLCHGRMSHTRTKYQSSWSFYASPSWVLHIPMQSSGHAMWNLWWTKWQWGKLFSEYFGFPFHRWSTDISFIYHRCHI